MSGFFNTSTTGGNILSPLFPQYLHFVFFIARGEGGGELGNQWRAHQIFLVAKRIPTQSIILFDLYTLMSNAVEIRKKALLGDFNARVRKKTKDWMSIACNKVHHAFESLFWGEPGSVHYHKLFHKHRSQLNPLLSLTTLQGVGFSSFSFETPRRRPLIRLLPGGTQSSIFFGGLFSAILLTWPY